jgi:5-methylcytosine-specific restriction endonuclease McrA
MFTRIKDVISGKAPLKSKRSSQWSKVRAGWLLKNNVCAACGCTNSLEVHHIKPFHLDPSLELDENNLITLCESKKRGVNCHLFFGHLGNYKKENPDVLKDSAKWHSKLNK